MRVAILGASGFIGRHLVAALTARGDEAVPADLRVPQQAAELAAGCSVVVNLAGAPVAKRWTAGHKRAIERSRTDLPRAFLAALATQEHHPARYVSASAIGYYGTSRTATFTEASPPGDDFLARVCVSWERVASEAAGLGMDIVVLRTGIVLGTDGGALAALLPLFRAGLGGVVASGEQWYSWIHVDDVVGLYLRAIDGSVDGVLNATAPEPVTNRAFTAALARELRRPAFFHVPLAAARLMLGEGATAIADGQRVLPERALAAGYAFRYPRLEAALHALVS